MSNILLTQNTGRILGPVAKLLGYIMEGIFYVIDKIGIPNIGLAIILFTIVIYLLLMPLTIKQQKFSKLSAKMNPELQEIRRISFRKLCAAVNSDAHIISSLSCNRQYTCLCR